MATKQVATEDAVDRLVQGWAAELPDIDLEVEAAVQRISWINKKLRRRLEETLADRGLSYEEWGLLGHLRLGGSPYCSSPGKLAENQGLSSGAMTNRLDNLEAAGLVRRTPHPDDRRGIQVELTEKGKEVWLDTVDIQAEKEAAIARALTKGELKELNALLRKVLLEFD